MSGALKTATTIVGLLAGIVTGVYVLGGLVISLRLLFDHFDFSSVVTILGQLPREPVIATALMDVIAPAATLGLLLAMLYGLRNRPRSREWRSDQLNEGYAWWLLVWIVFPVVSIALCAPAIHQAIETDARSPLLLTSVIGIAVTYGALATGWYLIRRVGRRRFPRLLRALAAGCIWAAIALTPAVMWAGAASFQPAQVCTLGAQVPQKGQLIGEGSGRVLLEQQFGNEAGVVALPSGRITKSEYGDLSSTFACPLEPGQKVVAKVAEQKLDGHGGELERRLAMKLRPRLRFDSRERWRPLEVESFLAERFGKGRRDAHQVCSPTPNRRCVPAIGIGQFHGGPEAPAYIDIHGEQENGADYESPNPKCRAAPPSVDCNDGPTAVIYYRRTTHEGRWYWDYWWFMRYNDYTGPFSKCNSRLCSDHEGDWEGITVVTTPTPEPEIVGALYAAHNDRILVEGSLLPRAGGHPLVFVAEGTHAAYPFVCHSHCKQYATLAGVHLPEDGHDGGAAWGGNSDADCVEFECVRPLPEVGKPSDLALPLAGSWAGWPGRWGETCHEGCESTFKEIQASPQSPGLQTRFKCPWAATRWALPSSDNSGLSKSERAGDAERLLAYCAAQRGGL